MVCIYCGSATQVINSRHQRQINQVWRRRKCTHCGSIFTTHEAVDLGAGFRVRQGQTLQPFNRDQLLVSIYNCCKHRKTALEDATALTATIISQLVVAAEGGIIDRSTIVTVAAEILERFDAATGTMYRAYHPITRAA